MYWALHVGNVQTARICTNAKFLFLLCINLACWYLKASTQLGFTLLNASYMIWVQGFLNSTEPIFGFIALHFFLLTEILNVFGTVQTFLIFFGFLCGWLSFSTFSVAVTNESKAYLTVSYSCLLAVLSLAKSATISLNSIKVLCMSLSSLTSSSGISLTLTALPTVSLSTAQEWAALLMFVLSVSFCCNNGF